MVAGGLGEPKDGPFCGSSGIFPNPQIRNRVHLHIFATMRKHERTRQWITNKILSLHSILQTRITLKPFNSYFKYVDPHTLPVSSICSIAPYNQQSESELQSPPASQLEQQLQSKSQSKRLAMFLQVLTSSTTIPELTTNFYPIREKKGDLNVLFHYSKHHLGGAKGPCIRTYARSYNSLLKLQVVRGRGRRSRKL